MSDDNFGIVFDRFADGKLAFRRLLAANDFPLKLFARVEIDTFWIGHVAARAHDVEIVLLTDFADGVVVSDPKSVRLRRLQLIENLAILVGAFREIGLRILILSSARPAKRADKTESDPRIHTKRHQEALFSS